jgi:hypothetical protein
MLIVSKTMLLCNIPRSAQWGMARNVLTGLWDTARHKIVALCITDV